LATVLYCQSMIKSRRADHHAAAIRRFVDEWEAQRTASDPHVREEAADSFSEALDMIEEVIVTPETPVTEREVAKNLLHTASRRVVHHARHTASDPNPSPSEIEAAWKEYRALCDLADRLPADHVLGLTESLGGWTPSDEQLHNLGIDLMIECYPKPPVEPFERLLRRLLPEDAVAKYSTRLRKMLERVLLGRLGELLAIRRETVFTKEDEAEFAAALQVLTKAAPHSD
jgi:hypothetical protein